MTAGFRSKLTYAAIAQQLTEIGEEVAERTIARRGAEWRFQQARHEDARQYVHNLVEAMKAQNVTAAEMVQALATDALLMDPEAFTSGDPIKVQRQNLQAETLRLKREELEIKRRLVSAEEARLRMLEAREQRAIAATEDLKAKAGRGEALTAADIDRIRGIYGIAVTEAAKN
jgi:hypothetical protein